MPSQAGNPISGNLIHGTDPLPLGEQAGQGGGSPCSV